jgi:hypothetical protein
MVDSLENIEFYFCFYSDKCKGVCVLIVEWKKKHKQRVEVVPSNLGHIDYSFRFLFTLDYYTWLAEYSYYVSMGPTK